MPANNHIIIEGTTNRMKKRSTKDILFPLSGQSIRSKSSLRIKSIAKDTCTYACILAHLHISATSFSCVCVWLLFRLFGGNIFFPPFIKWYIQSLRLNDACLSVSYFRWQTICFLWISFVSIFLFGFSNLNGFYVNLCVCDCC